jgi:hypothetical protein
LGLYPQQIFTEMPRIASGKDQAPARCENMTRLKARQQVANLITVTKIGHITKITKTTIQQRLPI